MKIKPEFVKHTRGYLLHNTKPIEAMTEERAIEYLIMKDIPQQCGEIMIKQINQEWLYAERINFLALEYGEMLGRLTKN